MFDTLEIKIFDFKSHNSLGVNSNTYPSGNLRGLFRTASFTRLNVWEVLYYFERARMKVAMDMRALVMLSQTEVLAEMKALRASILRGST